ncbi:MAG: lipopolysaccharide biosynthesis protein [Planctomycetota bacterium]
MSVAPGKRDKFYALADSAGRSMFRLLSAILVARLCGPAMYAVYVLCITIETVATAIPNAVNLSPMLSIGPGLQDDCREGFLWRVARRHVRWSAWLALFGALLAPLLVDEPLGAWPWLAFGAALFASGAVNAARSRQQARFRSRSVFWADFGGLMLPLLVALSLHDASPQVLLTGYFAATAVGFGLAALAMNRQRPASTAVPDDVLGRFHRMGPPMATGSVANSVCSRVQPFVLQAAAGAGAVGVFGAAATTIGPMRLLAMALSSVARPRLALFAGHADQRGAWRMLNKVCLLLGGCGVAGVVGALLLGEWLVDMVFGPEFAPVGQLLPLAFVFASLEATAAVMVVALQTLRENGAAAATRLRVGVSVLALVIVWPACSYASAAGAFAALCATELLFLVLAVIAIRQPRSVPGSAQLEAAATAERVGSA